MGAEDEANAFRLILVRGIDDRWRRIDRSHVVPAVLVVPALLVMPSVPAAISAERRRDGYTADH